MAKLVTRRGVQYLAGEQDEKTEQVNATRLFELVGGVVYTLGSRRAQYCPSCGSRTVDQGTRQTPGLSDLFAVIPPAPNHATAGLWIPIWHEVKGVHGALSP